MIISSEKGSSNQRPRALQPAGSAAIVTMSLARNRSEAQILLNSLRVLSKSGLPIYLGEGGSEEKFVRRLRRLPNICVCPPDTGSQQTLVTQVRSAFARAQKSSAQYFLYTEPDKRDFFSAGLRVLAGAARPDGSTRPRLILAARSTSAFATFPQGQRTAEALMNRVCGEAVGEAGDYTYGPMLISRRLLRYLPLVPDDAGWGWRFFLIAVAHQLRGSIELCTAGSPCPRPQRAEDDRAVREYRLRQLVENVTGLANGWTSLLDQAVESEPNLVAAA